MVRGIEKKVLAGLVLFLGFFVLLGCGNASAEEVTSVETTIRMNVEPIITVTFSTRAAILKASLKDQLDEIKVGAEIRTNSRTGYKAYLSTDKRRTGDSDNKATSLVHINNSEKYIPTLEESVTPANFPTNHWGYSVDGGEHYSGMKAVNDIDLADFTTSNSSENRNMDLYFATKIDNNQTNGYYENTIVVTAVANYVAQTINDIQYMQDINDEIALSMEEDHQYQLKDKRDNKKYWISKLKDGNVWMTQNLDYVAFTDNTNTKFVLTSDLSDVWTDYTIPVKYKATSTTDTSFNCTNGLTVDHYESNVAYNPTNDYQYYLMTSSQMANENMSHYRLGTKYSVDMMYFNNVYNQEYQKAPHNSEKDTLAYEYDEYIPNYSQSVCPKGWRLPMYKEFQLLPQYYGAFLYESAGNFEGSAAYPLLAESSYSCKQMIVDRSSKSSALFNAASFYISSYEGFSLTAGGNCCNNNSQFVRCVMRW